MKKTKKPTILSKLQKIGTQLRQIQCNFIKTAATSTFTSYDQKKKSFCFLSTYISLIELLTNPNVILQIFKPFHDCLKSINPLILPPPHHHQKTKRNTIIIFLEVSFKQTITNLQNNTRSKGKIHISVNVIVRYQICMIFDVCIQKAVNENVLKH